MLRALFEHWPSTHPPAKQETASPVKGEVTSCVGVATTLPCVGFYNSLSPLPVPVYGMVRRMAGLFVGDIFHKLLAILLHEDLLSSFS